MDQGLVVDRRDLIAKKSMRWTTEERFAFIWDESLVIGNYDRDRRKVMFLTSLEPEERDEATEWFEREIMRELITKEEEDKDEKDRD